MAKLEASLILEILGRPKENVITALQMVVENLEKEKGVKVVKKTLHEPLPVENSDLFTSFAEIDVELDSIMAYLSVIFGHMPSNIQIMHPEKITLDNIELNELGNALVQRLYKYDALTKGIVAERDMLAQRLYQVAPHLFKKPLQMDAPEIPAEASPKKSKKKKSKAN